MKQTLQVVIHNPYQDLGQGNYTGFRNNLSFEPTVEELNRTTSSRGGISDGSSCREAPCEEPLFGAHIREAAATVKKLLRSR